MTTARQEAMAILEKIPEDKLSFVIQIMQGINGLLGSSETNVKKAIDIEQFIMPATERGQNADGYIRELRDNNFVFEGKKVLIG